MTVIKSPPNKHSLTVVPRNEAFIRAADRKGAANRAAYTRRNFGRRPPAFGAQQPNRGPRSEIQAAGRRDQVEAREESFPVNVFQDRDTESGPFAVAAGEREKTGGETSIVCGENWTSADERR